MWMFIKKHTNGLKKTIKKQFRWVQMSRESVLKMQKNFITGQSLIFGISKEDIEFMRKDIEFLKSSGMLEDDVSLDPESFIEVD